MFFKTHTEQLIVHPKLLKFVLDSENGRRFKINKSQSSKMFMNLKIFTYLKKRFKKFKTKCKGK